MLEMGVAWFDSMRGWADLIKTDGCSLFRRQTNILVSRVYSLLAQSVEQMTVNHWVAGSSPAQGAKFRSGGRMVMQRIANPYYPRG
jgi:hypothetical protein